MAGDAETPAPAPAPASVAAAPASAAATPARTGRPGRSLPSGVAAGWLMARVFFRVALARRRTLWLGLLLLLPPGLAVYGLAAGQAGGSVLFDDIAANAFLGFLALVLPLFLGVSAVRDEIEDRTIVYLLTRPLKRSAIFGGKIVAVALVVAAALAADLVLVFLIAEAGEGFAGFAEDVSHLGTALGTIALASAAYSAAFGLCGILFARPMVVALLIGAGWELGASNLPGAFPRATLTYYLKSLLGLSPASAGGMLAMLLPPVAPASLAASLTVPAAAAAIFFAAALFAANRKELKV